MNDDDVFLKQMKGVNPIKKNNRVKKESLENKDIKNIKNKKNIKTNKLTKITHSVEKNIKKSEFNLENLSLKKGLKRGFFKIDKKIDFHGKTLLESEEYFSNTIISCYNDGLRSLLFVTGKGLFKTKKSDEEYKPRLYYGVIRSEFIGWVKLNKFSKYILSFEPALIEHGGDGAFYVYLRKKKN